jgi:N-acetylglucosamine kinase-like BadF-type ATPase
MIKLIADSGSTNTTWAVVSDNETRIVMGAGINPIHQDDDTIAHTLNELRAQLATTTPTHIYFYGAGCVGGSVNNRMRQCLEAQFGTAHICVESDLLGAARSLCGHREGIAGILGTGANSCQYDGQNIVANIPPLGYILGDEGSGASLGKAFLQALLRNELGEKLRDEFYEQYHTDYRSLIERIYRQPAANRFLASLSPFIASHLDCEPLHNIVANTFMQYMERHIMRYDYNNLTLHLTGSVAHYYRDTIIAVAQQKNIAIGNITCSPIEGLVSYHNSNEI